jgi:hypothetical protein
MMHIGIILTAVGLDCGVVVAQTVSYFPDLTQQADAIVVGKIAAGQPGNLQLLVDRNIKGSAAAGQILNVLSNAKLRRAAGQPWGDYGVWFLQSQQGGNWRIIPVLANRDFESGCYRLPEGVSPPKLTMANGGMPSVLDLTLAELTNAAEIFDPYGWEFDLLAENFRRMPVSPSLTAAYQRMSQSSKLVVRAMGISGLFKGDAASLERIPLDSATLSQLPVTVRGPMVNKIGSVRDPAPDTIAVLGRTATAESLVVGIRGKAAESLAMIHTKDTLPFLAILLDSPDAKLRNWAFVGFSEFVDNLPIERAEMIPTMAWMRPQGPQPYRTAETDQHVASTAVPNERHSEYASSFWKAWWSRMQSQIR